jgi:predicted alpha/beta superfamily hydrolase
MKPNNIKTGLRSAATVLFVMFITANISAQVLDSSRVIGPQIKTFLSKTLGEKRRIMIQTPSRMNKFDSFPVLYVLDGEVQGVMAGGQVQYLSDGYKIIPNLIVVSIENTDRTRDLTPTHASVDASGKPDTSANAFGKNSGGGEKFLQFIKEELMPYVEANYPTTPYKIFYGHSLGGLMAVYCLLHHPDYFNAYIAVSPSLQWDDKSLLRNGFEKLDKSRYNKRILFFSDANEDAAFHQNQLEFDSLLRLNNISGLKYRRMFYPEETHVSEPVKGFYDGIRFTYPNWYLPYNNANFKKTMNSKMIKQHFDSLTMNYGYRVIPPHDDIIQISRFLRNDPNRIHDAIDLLEMNASNYPHSAITQETLGDTWLKVSDNKKALDAYQKALALDPTNVGLQEKLKTVLPK